MYLFYHLLVQFITAVYVTAHQHQVLHLNEELKTESGRDLSGRLCSLYTTIPSLRERVRIFQSFYIK